MSQSEPHKEDGGQEKQSDTENDESDYLEKLVVMTFNKDPSAKTQHTRWYQKQQRHL